MKYNTMGLFFNIYHDAEKLNQNYKQYTVNMNKKKRKKNEKEMEKKLILKTIHLERKKILKTNK